MIKIWKKSSNQMNGKIAGRTFRSNSTGKFIATCERKKDEVPTVIKIRLSLKDFFLKLNRPFAASHSRGKKPPRWIAKVAQEQDKQKTYII